MTVKHGYAVGVVLFVARLRVNRSRKAVAFVNIVVEIKVIVGVALSNGIIYIGLRNVNPRVNVGILSAELRDIYGIFSKL